MSRSGTLLILCIILLSAEFVILPETWAAQGAAAQPSDARNACAADVQSLCSGVQPGGGRILACLKQHQDQVSDGCKRAILSAMGRSSGTAPAARPNDSPSPPVAPPASSTKSSVPSTPPSYAAAKGAAGSGQRYFVMKQVKIMDESVAQPRPAYELMIPTDWQFKSAMHVGSADGGCFGDWFTFFALANDPGKSMGLQLLPQATWQYIDDPAGQRQMQMQNQSDAQYHMKACPVRAPVRAEAYLRQDLLATFTKSYPSTTAVSAEPFPELAEMVRHQLGLPPGAAGGNGGNTRVDAARLRISFVGDKGLAGEGWMAAAIVVHILPAGGRGAAYDWHAVNVMVFYGPKGTLDKNDKLFKLMVSSIHPDPEWQRQSNRIIAALYQKKQEQVAQQTAMVAAFRQHVASVINGVTANQMAGANQAAFGQDQLVRGVQTFRNPATGGTLELSNQYDHAWLNGSDEYVMSDDPSFNPNGALNGNWSQLELVRPQP